jgi:hypothetical protein
LDAVNSQCSRLRVNSSLAYAVAIRTLPALGADISTIRSANVTYTKVWFNFKCHNMMCTCPHTMVACCADPHIDPLTMLQVTTA